MRATALRLLASVALPSAAAFIASGAAAAGRPAPSGLAYSSVSAKVVQHQPPAGSCHPIGAGLNERPDPRCTPGTVNPAVTQVTLGSTICRTGWTATVRPTAAITTPEKLASLRSYGEQGPSSYEYDHLVPLELGGAVNDPRNLWPQPDYPQRKGFYLNPKDRLETKLKHLVCDGTLTLAQAQRAVAFNWVGAIQRYG